MAAPSRLAICLIDMSGARGRVDGCVGLALDQQQTCVKALASPSDAFAGPDDAVAVAAQVLELLRGTTTVGPISIDISRATAPHVGLGSKTQLMLAVAKATAVLFDLPFDTYELAAICGRGGTSGAGIAAFAHGGLTVDAGHKFGTGGKERFAPSSSRLAPPALPIATLHPPERWRVLVARPTAARGLSGAAEQAFFSRSCPVPTSEVAHTCWTILSCLLPAVAEHDLAAAQDAIHDLQATGFKRALWAEQAPEVHALRARMTDLGFAGIGMSSVGPSLFALIDHEDALTAPDLVADCRRHGLEIDAWTSGIAAAGAEVTISQL